jgi:hypothetical protein
MAVVAKVKLMIRDQSELLNQIAGTYKDFYRAAMEYVDNAIDASVILLQRGELIKPVLKIHIDTVGKKVIFTDNCGGMGPQELCELLSEVGRSKKKAVPWANGQFGFGVHAFRAFAREATFISKKKSNQEAKIKIDRSFDETVEVPCESTDGKQLDKPGTRVIISRFDPQVFKKSIFMKMLISEVEHHFDDVLRAKLITITVTEDNSKAYECKHFDFNELPGTPLKKNISVCVNADEKEITVDLKVLDRVQDNRLPVLTNKQRRIQTITDLRSYKIFVRNAGKTAFIWSNPFVVGSVEINDLCSPNLTRDDIKDSSARDALYEKLLAVQMELQSLVDDIMNRKTQESFKKLGALMSDCLSRIMRSFKLQFEQTAPTGKPGKYERRMVEEMGDVPFGGEEAGGGGIGPNEVGSGGQPSLQGRGGIGDKTFGGGEGPNRKGIGSGYSEEQVVKSSGPRIEFQNHAGEDRVIDLGNSLIVNTQHPDFIQRNTSKSGKIKLDARLLNYVSLVIAPPCVHRLFEKKGMVPNALEAGTNIVDLSTRLEQELISTVLGTEIEGSA